MKIYIKMLNFNKMIDNLNFNKKCFHPKCYKKGLYNYEKNGYAYCYKHKKVGMIRVNDECVIS